VIYFSAVATSARAREDATSSWAWHAAPARPLEGAAGDGDSAGAAGHDAAAALRAHAGGTCGAALDALPPPARGGGGLRAWAPPPALAARPCVYALRLRLAGGPARAAAATAAAARRSRKSPTTSARRATSPSGCARTRSGRPVGGGASLGQYGFGAGEPIEARCQFSIVYPKTVL
jgi:hypothetical protein